MKTYQELFDQNETAIERVLATQEYQNQDGRKNRLPDIQFLYKERERLSKLIIQYGADATPATALQKTGAFRVFLY